MNNFLKKGKPWNYGLKGSQVAWNKGKKLSDKHRKNLSIAHITTGTTEKDKLARRSVDFIKWRKQVFERDAFTCRSCLKVGCRLVPHHIGSFSKFVKLRFDSDNGITMCQDCHIEFHKTFGFKNFISENIILFLSWNKKNDSIPSYN